MKLTVLEIVNAHKGLPALVERLLAIGEVGRALEVSATITELQKYAEIFQLTQSALLNAHGVKDRDTRQNIIVAGSDGFEKYKKAQSEMLEREMEVGVELIVVNAEEMQGIDPVAFVRMSRLLTLAK